MNKTNGIDVLTVEVNRNIAVGCNGNTLGS